MKRYLIRRSNIHGIKLSEAQAMFKNLIDALKWTNEMYSDDFEYIGSTNKEAVYINSNGEEEILVKEIS